MAPKTKHQPGPFDVVLGRGGHVANLPGNILFRTLVLEAKDKYGKADRADKRGISKEIVATIASKGGLFLEKTGSTGSGRYKEVRDTNRKIEKTSQALREKKHGLWGKYYEEFKEETEENEDEEEKELDDEKMIDHGISVTECNDDSIRITLKVSGRPTPSSAESIRKTRMSSRPYCASIISSENVFPEVKRETSSKGPFLKVDQVSCKKEARAGRSSSETMKMKAAGAKNGQQIGLAPSKTMVSRASSVDKKKMYEVSLDAIKNVGAVSFKKQYDLTSSDKKGTGANAMVAAKKPNPSNFSAGKTLKIALTSFQKKSKTVETKEPNKKREAPDVEKDNNAKKTPKHETTKKSKASYKASVPNKTTAPVLDFIIPRTKLMPNPSSLARKAATPGLAKQKNCRTNVRIKAGQRLTSSSPFKFAGDGKPGNVQPPPPESMGTFQALFPSLMGYPNAGDDVLDFNLFDDCLDDISDGDFQLVEKLDSRTSSSPTSILDFESAPNSDQKQGSLQQHQQHQNQQQYRPHHPYQNNEQTNGHSLGMGMNYCLSYATANPSPRDDRPSEFSDKQIDGDENPLDDRSDMFFKMIHTGE